MEKSKSAYAVHFKNFIFTFSDHSGGKTVFSFVYGLSVQLKNICNLIMNNTWWNKFCSVTFYSAEQFKENQSRHNSLQH